MNERQKIRLAKLIMKHELDITGKMFAGDPWEAYKDEAIDAANKWARVIDGDTSDYRSNEWFHWLVEQDE